MTKQVIFKFDKSDDCQATWDKLVDLDVHPDNLASYWLQGQFWLIVETNIGVVSLREYLSMAAA